MPGQHKIVLVYDTETKEAIEVGLNTVDFFKWANATDERRDRTLRRQVVKRREKMRDIIDTAISDMKRMRAEPDEISDLLFFVGLRTYRQGLPDAPEEADDDTEQEDDIGN